MIIPGPGDGDPELEPLSPEGVRTGSDVASGNPGVAKRTYVDFGAPLSGWASVMKRSIFRFSGFAHRPSEASPDYQDGPAEHAGATGRSDAGKPSWSLAARLSAWYAAFTFLILLLACTFLYWVLLTSTETEDDQYLREKVNVLSTLLRDQSPESGMVHWEVQEESATRPLARVLSRVLTADGQIAVETEGMSRELPPALFPTPSGPGLQGAAGADVSSNSGTPFHLLSATVERLPGRLGNSVQVAIDVTYEQNLFNGYRRKIYFVLGLGILVSALVGHAIARRGLRPVTDMSNRIRQIRSTTLNERLEPAGLPSELQSLANTFNEMLGHLEDAFSRLSRFSSDIAHELRTPVNNLRGEVEVALARARSPEEYRDALGSSLEECRRLSHLIDSLLFLARAENPETRIHREPLSLAAELAKIREFYEAAAAEAGVSLDLEVAAPEQSVSLDRTLIQRALGNLIENALANTPQGGSVRIAVDTTDGNTRITVSDNGRGIPESHLPHIFDRFYRVDGARSKNTGGSGLGLAIVKGIVTLHGGRVDIQSEPGHGTSVSLYFRAGLS